MRLPLAAFRSPDDALLLGADGEISAGVFFARVGELARALPDAPFVINLCESRLGFMLAFAAALVRGQTSLLPAAQGRGDWEQLVRQYPGAYVVSDRAIDAEHAFDLRSYLAMNAAASCVTPIPEIAADLTAAILFTSGSTGQPTAHAKSWGQLWQGAANLMAALRWPSAARYAVVGSVPPQHMFGLESTVMLPWYAGVPVHAVKPLLPADLEIALTQCARPTWWMTTPLHLRAPLQAATRLPELAGIVTSTMSLPATLAKAAEHRWQSPVMEIYGSTETGALAMRRTAADQWWTPLPGIELAQQTDGDATVTRATGSHIGASVTLGDELRIGAEGRFLWLGRSADMQKIGGKRASLSALNLWIAAIDGIDDAVYFAPDALGDAAAHDDTHPARRLAAFYVSTTLSPADVRAALRTRVDPVFMPRPLFRVARLPRDANGKLSHAALAGLLSQAQQAANDSTPPRLVVPGNHPSLAGHFPGTPIVPGVVILSLVIQAINHQLPHIVLGTLLSMRFHTPLRPDQPLTVHVELRGERVRIEARVVDVQSGSGALIATGQWAIDAASRAVERP